MAVIPGKGAIRVIGLDDALHSLNKDIAKVPFRTLKGMIAGGLILQRKSQQLVPVDTANLKASATTLWGTKGGTSTPNFKGDDAAKMEANHKKIVSQEKAGLSKSVLKPEVEVVYTAAYAIYVHEDLEAKHKVGQAKYLEDAAKEAQAEIIAAVKMETKL